MPLGVMKQSRVAVAIRNQAAVLTVGDLAPGTIFKLFATAPNGDNSLGFSKSGRIFVRAGSGRGRTGQVLKDHYNGDIAPLAIVLPNGPNDDRAFTPCTYRLTEDTPVAQVLGNLEISIF